jgi:hypothetical protein
MRRGGHAVGESETRRPSCDGGYGTIAPQVVVHGPAASWTISLCEIRLTHRQVACQSRSTECRNSGDKETPSPSASWINHRPSVSTPPLSRSSEQRETVRPAKSCPNALCRRRSGRRTRDCCMVFLASFRGRQRMGCSESSNPQAGSESSNPQAGTLAVPRLRTRAVLQLLLRGHRHRSAPPMRNLITLPHSKTV